mmetsp:Transcript_2530/g.9702  ORF Transcript_2530/g.9702 Transcript_2530/m.9702 type:complete len:286 (+) Transcript_2530:65-922(+)|eukprot:CAMPEP_0185701056 /NCGR_PEP_ID=MMETSP1164-20130828/8393_1 /TAXON_ID=1104430 /ORGANISM="Chrysoreinhardia sp, Strain CCMP2950" /LENGTH=285 /DNA_ID=CAMNT_0028368043 /DNA_START=32 /DNA_END=889 /DNA_ORIENTATION=+
MTATIAVMTASSNSGAAAVEALLAHPSKPRVRAIFRDQAKATAFKEQSTSDLLEVVGGADASKPETLDGVFAGASAAIVVTPHFDFAKDAELTVAMLRAAEGQGVGRAVMIGSWTVAAPETIIAQRFVPTEAFLRDETKMKWTVLRSGYFCGNYAGLFKGKDAVYFPEITVPPVDPTDIGRVAAAICVDADPSTHDAKCYDISGPEQLTTTEIVDKVKKATARPDIAYHAVPVAGLKPPAPPEFLIQLLTYIDAHGLPCDAITKTLSGRHTTFDQYLAEHLEDFS